MAAPAVSGGMALLVERYRQLHPEWILKMDLMKALVCIPAWWGTARSGLYTWVRNGNFWRAVNVMERHPLSMKEISLPRLTLYITLRVPAGIAALKSKVILEHPLPQLYPPSPGKWSWSRSADPTMVTCCHLFLIHLIATLNLQLLRALITSYIEQV